MNIMATNTKKELEQKIAELEKEIKRLTESKTVVEGEADSETESVPAPTPAPTPVYVSTPSTDVVVVYTSHSLGHLEGKLFSIDASVYGEEFTLSRSQFDELVGKYRRWFDSGILAVSHRNIDIAASKGLPTDKDNGLTVRELRSLGKMSTEQIEKLWEKAQAENLRMSIVTYFKEKFLANEPGFRDRARVDCLNRLTDGGFDPEVTILSGRPLKIAPTDLMTATED